MELRAGVDPKLEDEADRFLKQDPDRTSSVKSKRFWLTQDQLDLRESREIHNSRGVADASLVRGQYNKAYNPQAGKRPTRSNQFSQAMDPWGQAMVEQIDNPEYVAGMWGTPGQGVSDYPHYPSPPNPFKEEGRVTAPTIEVVDQIAPPEHWLPISGYPGYELSDHGRARSYAGRGGTRLAEPHLLGFRMTRDKSHITIRIRRNGTHTELRLAELVLETFGHARPRNSKVIYWDDDHRNCKLENLSWVHDPHERKPRKVRKAKVTATPRAEAVEQPLPEEVMSWRVWQVGDFRVVQDANGTIETPDGVRFTQEEQIAMRVLLNRTIWE